MNQKKSFHELTVGDTFFMAGVNSINYEIKTVSGVELDTFSYSDNYSGVKIPRWKDNAKEFNITRYHISKYIFFVKETDAIRYCKAQMMKNLYLLIKNAKIAIKAVKDFRYEKDELLNHKWTEGQINMLEKEINQ